MFGVLMLNWISGEINNTYVVIISNDDDSEQTMKFKKKMCNQYVQETTFTTPQCPTLALK